VLKTPIMNKTMTFLMTGIAVMLAGQTDPASAQFGALQKRLAATTRIDCKFSTLATGTWDDGSPAAEVTSTDLELSFSEINIEEGTADADSRFGPSFIVVRYTTEYLHLVQMFGAGPLYVTTVLARETTEGRLMAIHTRHEYTPTQLVGFTSRPEMYVGDCEVDG
jgi:hypothetical protein